MGAAVQAQRIKLKHVKNNALPSPNSQVSVRAAKNKPLELCCHKVAFKPITFQTDMASGNI